jgi:hypothetical protein
VRIESFDRVLSSSMMVGEEEAPVPAASLGPNLGGMGQATRGRWMPLETKNTEAGWGVVHLYREADEAGALRAAVSTGEGIASGSGSGGDEGDEDDGTVLCIPAVPSYLSPGDFLGFIGEKWRGDVSHYRMVMTSRLSRYMVLMKFRDARVARQWREEFDGKPFDSLMEVSSMILGHGVSGPLRCGTDMGKSLRFAMSRSSSRLRSRHQARRTASGRPSRTMWIITTRHRRR